MNSFLVGVCEEECSLWLGIIGTYQGCNACATSWCLWRMANSPGSTWICTESPSLSCIPNLLQLFFMRKTWNVYIVCSVTRFKVISIPYVPSHSILVLWLPGWQISTCALVSRSGDSKSYFYYDYFTLPGQE